MEWLVIKRMNKKLEMNKKTEIETYRNRNKEKK